MAGMGADRDLDGHRERLADRLGHRSLSRLEAAGAGFSLRRGRLGGNSPGGCARVAVASTRARTGLGCGSGYPRAAKALLGSWTP